MKKKGGVRKWEDARGRGRKKREKLERKKRARKKEDIYGSHTAPFFPTPLSLAAVDCACCTPDLPTSWKVSLCLAQQLSVR